LNLSGAVEGHAQKMLRPLLQHAPQQIAEPCKTKLKEKGALAYAGTP
jgi:hypothetical protein